MHPDLTLTLSDIGIRLLMSLIIGIIIGLEREIQHKAAGLRTSVLICLGATIYTIGSIEFASSGGNVDPSRIAAQIVTGIGFLGAGTIIQTRGSVHGLTTAATIWVMAALGLAVGLGSYVLAIGGAVLAVVVLNPFQAIENAVNGKKTTCTYTLTVSETGPALTRINQAFQRGTTGAKEIRIQKDGPNQVITFDYTDQDGEQSRFAEELSKTSGVIQINVEQCS
jgi:putative Mg2+ transporter-C (MgtC) family protein